MSSNNNNTYKRRIADVCDMMEQRKQKQQPEVDAMDARKPQQPQHHNAKRNGNFHATNSSRGSLQPGKEYDDRKPPAMERRGCLNATTTTTNSSQRHLHHSYRHHSSLTSDPLADRLSSSLASIAFRQQQQRGGSASSSSDSSSNNSHLPALVTSDGYGGNNAGTTVGSTSSSSNSNAHHHLGGSTTTNSSSNSGSGGDEDVVVTTSKATTTTHARRNSRNHNNGFSSAAVAGTMASSKEQKQSHSLYAHHARHNQSPPRASSSTTTGGICGLEGDRSAHHHASVVAESSLSSSGYDEQSGNLSFSRGPAYHIIKQTLMQTTTAATSSNSSSSKRKHQLLKKKQQQQEKRADSISSDKAKLPHKRHHKSSSSFTEENYASNTSSSGSGTEAGYEGSASSNDIVTHRGGGSKSDSKDSTTGSSSSDNPDFSSGASESNAFATFPSNSPSLSSSGDDDDEDNDTSSDNLGDRQKRRGQRKTSKNIWHHPKGKTSLSLASLQKKPSTAMAPTPMDAVAQFTKITRPKKIAPVTTVGGVAKSASKKKRATTGLLKQETTTKSPILSLGSDIFVHVLTFLEPPEIQRVVTMPLSRDWLATYCNQQELWRVLCLLEPFKARHVSDEDFSSSSSSSEDENDDDGSLSSFSANDNSGEDAWAKRRRQEGGQCRRLRPRKPQKLGKYRLLYTSFTRCMRYLARIREDALHGRPPSVIDYGGSSVLSPRDVASNRSLQQFLAGARDMVERERVQDDGERQQEEISQEMSPPLAAVAKANRPILSADDGSSSYSSSVEDRRSRKRKKSREQNRRKKPKFGRSMLTDRLLGPTSSGEVNPQNVTLPWSCALYSIVNWMVCFSEVEGIQIMCLKVLPCLLEDEQQRITAQRVRLTDVVLRGMVLFPDNVQLHSASFHTLVLLARPLGGREGMLFHSSMVNSAGIFSGGAASAVVANNNNNAGGNSDADGNSSGSTGTVFSGANNNGQNGISVMLDSMRRFQSNGELQGMACWSLVNIALAPAQKQVLVKLGGIEATTNAMLHHPHNPEVQFRALFALINLVIPSVNVSEENGAEGQQQDDLDNIASGGLTEELDEMVSQIADLVVLAMKNFCSSEAILNRACLVLHNLSLTQGYHTTLLWTPNCYQMLEWCLANYRTDHVLQQSAAGTLHRLQVTLSNDENLRSRFAASIQAQQQLSLEAAHREALELYEQQERLRLPQQNGTP